MLALLWIVQPVYVVALVLAHCSRCVVALALPNTYVARTFQDSSNPLSQDVAVLGEGSAKNFDNNPCGFELYDPARDLLRMVHVQPDNIVFHEGTVFVVDGAPDQHGVFQRYLTFKQASAVQSLSALDGYVSANVEAIALAKCREQVQVACHKSERGAPQTVSEGTSLVDVYSTPDDRCNVKQCLPDVLVNAVPEYRVLIGSTLSNPAKINRAAVLGVGAGIIPLAISRSHPHATIDAVDISDDVIAAVKCFGLQAGDQMRLVHADGRAYLDNLEDGVLDMLFVDIYDDRANIPSCFITKDFFLSAQKKLSTEGVLAMNVVTHQLDSVLPGAAAAFPSLRLGSFQANRGNKVLLARSSYNSAPAETPAAVSGPQERLMSSFAAWARDGVFEPVNPSGLSAPGEDAQLCKQRTL